MGRKGGILLVLVLAIGATIAMRGRAQKLPDAQIATEIPVYPGAKYEDMGTGLMGDDLSNMDTRSRTWWFDVDDPASKVVQYYEAKLGQKATVDEDDGSRSFEVRPPSAYPDERVRITVEEKKLTINEMVRLNRKPKS